MGRITLPRKIQKRTIIKLFMLSVFIFTGVYLYPTFKNINQKNIGTIEFDGQVLASVTTVTPDKIDNYFHKNNIREDCASLQPDFNVNCVGSLGGRLDMPGKNYYANPVLEEVLGEPIVFFKGGVYQINRSGSNGPNVNLISRLYSSVNGEYTGACFNGYSPSAVLNYGGNKILWGSQGIQFDQAYRCMNNQSGDYSLSVCNDIAAKFGIPIMKNWTYGPNIGKPCLQNDGSFCWDRNYDCKMLGGDTQYWNTSHMYRVAFSKNSSGALVMSLDRPVRTVAHPGYDSEDADVYCSGKKRDGSCTKGLIGLALGYQGLALRLRDVDVYTKLSDGRTVPEANIILYESLNSLTINNYTRSGWKSFYSRSYYGFMNHEQFSRVSDFSGFETPAEILPTKVDYLQYASSVLGDPSQNQIDKKTIDYSTGKAVNPNYSWELQSKLNFNPNYYSSNVLSDFATERYFLSLRLDSKFLYLTRYKPTGLLSNNYTLMNTVSMPNPSFTWMNASTRPNVTIGITSNDDIDILVAPHYTMMLNRNIPSRVFRAEGFNKPNGQAYGKFIELTDLVSNPNGYKFDNPGPGNNYPITMRYYNTDDKDLNNDYAVFVSKNYVFTSELPSSCTPNFNLVGGGLNLVNTSPLSINKGILPNTIDATNSNYDLNFTFNSAINLSCPSGIVQVPAGTTMYLTLFDGITSAPLPTTLSASLLTDRKSFNFTDIDSPNFKKYFYQVSFNYNGSVYKYPSSGVVQDRFYTLESFLNMYMFLDNTDQDPFPDAKMVITKTLVGAPNSPIQYNLTAPDGVSEFALNNDTFKTFFWDHNMKKIGTTLVDDTKYRICITNTSDSKITRIGFNDLTTTSTTSISNNYLSGTLNNGCLDLFYKSNIGTSYNVVPQGINLYVSVTTTPAPVSYLNFRVNGNAMVKNSADAKMYSTSDTDKKYEGIYISGTAKGSKDYTLTNTLMSSYYNIPYFSNLTKAINFSYTEDLVEYTLPSTEVTFLLLTDKKTSGSVSNYTKIDAFASIPTSITPTIIYVAKNKQLVFDLTDLNIATPLENVYIVSTDKVNAKERIVFKVDCSDLTNYSLVCGPNAVVNIKGGIYGDFKITGNLSTQNQNRSFVTINQNPEILIYLQKDLRSNKIFNVTRSKTIFKYFND